MINVEEVLKHEQYVGGKWDGLTRCNGKITHSIGLGFIKSAEQFCKEDIFLSRYLRPEIFSFVQEIQHFFGMGRNTSLVLPVI